MSRTFTFEFQGDPAERDEQARSLAKWLNDSEDLDDCATVRLTPPSRSQLGPLADAAIATVEAGVPIAAAVVTWLRERRRSGVTRLRAIRPDGATLEIEVGDPARLAEADERVREFLRENEEDD
jgi:Effector Associated Constant Component 1